MIDIEKPEPKMTDDEVVRWMAQAPPADLVSKRMKHDLGGADSMLAQVLQVLAREITKIKDKDKA